MAGRQPKPCPRCLLGIIHNPQPCCAAPHAVLHLLLQVHAAYDDVWERRDVMGIHPQKQEGLFWAGAVVPAGRLVASDFHALADAAEK